MTIHPTIDAELAVLAQELPEPFVAELADGYAETYSTHLHRLRPEDAASATIAEFGNATTICAAFRANAPGRRFARVLVATGPLFGATWAAALLTQETLRAALAIPVRLVTGALLLALVATLLVAATARLRYGAVRTASTAAAYTLVPVDAAAVATVVALQAPAPATVLAVALSLTRIAYTLSSLRTVQRS